MAICPYCDVTLETDDVYDNEYNWNSFIELIVGHYPNCNKSFQWKEIYLYDHAEDIEEVGNE